MDTETKVAETPKVSVAETLIENPRAAIENAVIAENETPNVTEPQEETKSEETPKEETPEAVSESDPIENIKKSVQKRINQVIAQKKSVEDRLAEAEAELARLKSTPKPEVAEKKDDAPPTIEQVEAYIIKMAEEGNKKEEVAATRYLIKLEKEAAIREVEERQVKIKQEADSRIQRENQALSELAKDYIAYDANGQVDMRSDLTLANQKGKLFETAMALYNDAELHKTYYSDNDRALGFRRAVQDASRELHAQGLVKTPKVEGIEAIRRTPRVALADPDGVEAEETPTQSNSSSLSDAEKVREEIKQRNRMRNSRKVS